MSDLPALLEDVPKMPTYEQIRALEKAMVENLPTCSETITHHFADGVYGREMFMPAGMMLTGKMHRFSTLNFLLSGDITVTTPEGVRRIQAPAMFVSPAGMKKVMFAHTDAVFATVHPTKITDIASIESKFIIPEAPLIEEKEQ